ncbi:enoyl-CoA hydratase/isomerase family protein [Arthrobacter sp. ISL-5]|uniref:enoyl-CoA hydratase/isomerase family protein n=1 Tax=Arthrobacter sp. ISL-5 TaxID=2819111 RepID=UPI001BE6A6F2|nr:enoyl-CoA hydratase/isomerase family protein [Arthrobacter sp. ISL-5]MBT2554148.1 enoyl-CoA hydratase/isomerase family protein [Arthrobacter sp. ISL-5]
MNSKPLRVEQRGPARWLFLNRPAQRNALNSELTDALDSQIDDIAYDQETAVVVLTGEGPGFSAGGDFRHFLELDEEDGVLAFLTRLSSVVTRIEQSPKPWIAALHGHAIAGGLEIALACDLVIAAEGTLVGDGHVNNKLMPGAGSSVRLERAVGKSAARWMHLSGQPMTAEELRRTGWLHDVVPRERLRERAGEVAAELASRDTVAQQNMKNLLKSIAGLDAPAALKAELDAFDSNWRQNDVPGALRTFLAARGTTKQEARA